jgi:hypothetical protein
MAESEKNYLSDIQHGPMYERLISVGSCFEKTWIFDVSSMMLASPFLRVGGRVCHDLLNPRRLEERLIETRIQRISRIIMILGPEVRFQKLLSLLSRA